MESRDNGGPAFPHVSKKFQGMLAYSHTESGMSLRDWFAGMALASGNCPVNSHEHDQIAAWAHAIADAMLKARNEIEPRKAENAALRQPVPVWNVITYDLRSYPRSGERVVVQLVEGAHHGIVARRGAVVEYRAECGVTETETWFDKITGNLIPIRPGDRWTYIPEAK